MKVSINSKVVFNKLASNRKLLAKTIEEFNGKEITITIENKKKKRSNEQNKYYWGVIIKLIQNAIKEEWGERKTSLEVHEMLKAKFNFTEHVNEGTGEILLIGKSTTENTTTQQEEYQEDCRIFAKEWFNIEIPLPNEELEIDFKE